MERPQKLIVDCAKGTQTYVDLTDEEILQRDKDMQAEKDKYALTEIEQELEQQLWEN